VDDEQERAPRLLLLDEAAVSHEADSAHRLSEWTTTSSHDTAPGAIATRDCTSWRRIARAIACASKR
jgi:hypothetical protein